MAGEIQYKGYKIEPKSQKLKSGKWSTTALVIYNDGDQVTFTPLHGTGKIQDFEIEDEANQRAVEMAKSWIDGRD